MDEKTIRINRLAQGLDSVDTGIEWFQSGAADEKQLILDTLAMCASQSHPRLNEIDEGIKLSGLKPTFTPCVLIKAKPFKEAIGKIRNLPENEWEKAFRLLLALFSIADSRRRRTDCKHGCSHPWHQLARS
jgi:hypothetical protein